MTVKHLRSKASGSGPALFFPDPEVPAIFNFDQGLAAPETFPIADLERLAKQVIDEAGPPVLDYFDPKVGYEELVFGYRKLRSRIAGRIQARQGRDLGHMGVILTSGSVQGIALLMQAYLDKDDVVAVEAASFPYALRFATTAGGEIRPVPVDDDGMDIDALESLIAGLKAAGRRLKIVYTIPTFQTPTATEMSVERRRRLVALAEAHDFLIVEDDVYGELRFAGEALPTLLSLDKAGKVVQCGSFSKMVAPALRLGWIAGPAEAIEPLAAVRQDLGVAQWIARVMDAFMAEGLLEPHLARANEVYRRKAETAAKAMRDHCGEYVCFLMPQGSFYLWVEIDDRVDWATASARAAKEGIFFRPGERFMGDTGGRQFLRLAYSHVSEKIIADGIAHLGAILHECARKAA